MSKTRVWYIFVGFSFIYQVSFLYSYFTGCLVDMNLVLARTYWISAGLLGIANGAFILIKVDIGLLGRMAALGVMMLGIGLVSLWLLAFAVTSM